MSVFIDGYEIDVTTDETHTFDSMVTTSPVESGSDITDNVKLSPDSVTLTGIVSDTPFGQLAERRANEEVSKTYSTFALELLLEIREKREPVTVETTIRKYENMVLESLSVPVNVRTGDSLQFTATFRRIRIVSTERSTVRVEVPRAKRKVKRGSEQVDDAEPTAATTAEVKKNRSWGNKLKRAIF